MNKALMIHQGAELYGSDRSFLSIAAYFKEHHKSEFEVILPHQGDLSNKFEGLGITPSFHNFGVLRKKDIKRPLKFLYDLCRSISFYNKKFKRFDIIYINTVVMLSALLAAFFHKDKKIICHVREIPSSKQMWLFKILLKLSRAKLIYNSEATKKAFNIDGSVIYNGVEAASVDNKPVKHSAVKNLLVIGRINDWKGQDLLLDAISKVSRSALENINVRIVGGTFGGNNDFFDKLKLFVHQKKLDNHVSFHNFTNDPSNHFLWSDWVIVPSKRPEPFGRVAVEAFAYSKPVVAANHGGLAEILTNKVNGYFFAPNSSPDLASVIEIIHDLSHGEYIEFSKAALAEYNKRFSEASYQKYLYDNIVGL